MAPRVSVEVWETALEDRFVYADTQPKSYCTGFQPVLLIDWSMFSFFVNETVNVLPFFPKKNLGYASGHWSLSKDWIPGWACVSLMNHGAESAILQRDLNQKALNQKAGWACVSLMKDIIVHAWAEGEQ